MEQCHALVWEYNKLQSLLAEYPQIGRNISHILSNRLGELQERFCEVATEKVAQRLALALLRLLKQVGKPGRGGIEIALSREELAHNDRHNIVYYQPSALEVGRRGLCFARREAAVVLDAQRLAQVGSAEG